MSIPFRAILGLITLSGLTLSAGAEPPSLLNASYDVSRAFYTDYNKLFAADWKTRSGRDVDIRMAHGGSSVQARAVLDGLDADVVTMNQDTDVDILADRGHMLSRIGASNSPTTASRTPPRSCFSCARETRRVSGTGRSDQAGGQRHVPQPKTSGNEHYSYLAAWGYALKKKWRRRKQGQGFRHAPVQERPRTRQRGPRRDDDFCAPRNRQHTADLRERGLPHQKRRCPGWEQGAARVSVDEHPRRPTGGHRR